MFRKLGQPFFRASIGEGRDDPGLRDARWLAAPELQLAGMFQPRSKSTLRSPSAMKMVRSAARSSSSSGK
jgi:hypothetical protein